MKGLFALVTIIILFGFIVPKKENKLIGQWEIYKIQEAGKKPKEKRRKYVVFLQDGILNGGKIGEEPRTKGTWSFDKKSNMLTINSEHGNKDDGEYFVEKLTRKDLVIVRGSTHIYMEKKI